jgi:hypothetical protein
MISASLQDQIAEVKREIEMRKRTYIRMIDQGKMTAGEADRRTTVMIAVLLTLEELRDVRRGEALAHSASPLS